MRRHLEEQDNLDRFVAEYARPVSDAARQVERTVLGHEVGLNGYTTVDQADGLVAQLALSAATRLLEVGAGRSWPGSHLAAVSGSRLVATDIPLDALRAAKAYLGSSALGNEAHVIAADGRALPFSSGRYDAVVHADVFC